MPTETSSRAAEGEPRPYGCIHSGCMWCLALETDQTVSILSISTVPHGIVMDSNALTSRPVPTGTSTRPVVWLIVLARGRRFGATDAHERNGTAGIASLGIVPLGTVMICSSSKPAAGPVPNQTSCVVPPLMSTRTRRHCVCFVYACERHGHVRFVALGIV